MIIDLPLNAKQRRNIFLVIKEIANNTLKYAGADDFYVSFKIENAVLQVTVGDNGKGFEENNIPEYRNGLKNISRRIYELHGTIIRKSVPGKGTWYDITLDLEKTI
jgi:signal transduction histidine kinase